MPARLRSIGALATWFTDACADGFLDIVAEYGPQEMAPERATEAGPVAATRFNAAVLKVRIRQKADAAAIKADGAVLDAPPERRCPKLCCIYQGSGFVFSGVVALNS